MNVLSFPSKFGSQCFIKHYLIFPLVMEGTERVTCGLLSVACALFLFVIYPDVQVLWLPYSNRDFQLILSESGVGHAILILKLLLLSLLLLLLY